MQAPLEGVRVVEIAHYVAVPAAGGLLADLGADVIKVEVPPKGELYQWRGNRTWPAQLWRLVYRGVVGKQLVEGEFLLWVTYHR